MKQRTIRSKITVLLFTTLTLVMLPGRAYTQEFTVVSAGELDLESDEITSPDVTKYFGMYVEGAGASIIRVTSGESRAEKSYTFQLSSTRLYSYLLSYNNLVQDLGVAFRRGVVGTIEIAILNAAREEQAVVSIDLNVTRKKSVCKKFPSKKIKTCAPLNLEKASKRQRQSFVKKFVSSIRGPIVLEP